MLSLRHVKHRQACAGLVTFGKLLEDRFDLKKALRTQEVGRTTITYLFQALLGEFKRRLRIILRRVAMHKQPTAAAMRRRRRGQRASANRLQRERGATHPHENRSLLLLDKPLCCAQKCGTSARWRIR